MHSPKQQYLKCFFFLVMILPSNVSYEILNFPWCAWCIYLRPCWQMLRQCLVVASTVGIRCHLPLDVMGQSLFQRLSKDGANWSILSRLVYAGNKLYVKKFPESVPSPSRLWALKGLHDAQGMAQGRETMSLVPTLGFGWADAKKFFLSLTQANPSAWAFFSVDTVCEGKLFWKEDYLCQKSKIRNKSCGI